MCVGNQNDSYLHMSLFALTALSNCVRKCMIDCQHGWESLLVQTVNSVRTDIYRHRGSKYTTTGRANNAGVSC